MILYHGSTQIIQKPDVSFAKQNLDFGPGFYLTSYEEQAQKWAVRKAMRQHVQAYVNIYKLDDLSSDFNTLQFDNQNVQWLNYVAACRQGQDVYKSYDIVKGGVANDDVFRSIDMYIRGIWDIERTIKELSYYKVNNQICILNQRIIELYLHFDSAYEV